MAKQYCAPQVECCSPEAELLEPAVCDDQQLLGNAEVGAREPTCPPDDGSPLLDYEHQSPASDKSVPNYEVREDDTLESIASNQCGSIDDAPRITAANPDIVGSKGELVGGSRLWIPPHDTKRALTRASIEGMETFNEPHEPGNEFRGIDYPTQPLDLRDGQGPAVYPEGYIDPNFWEPTGERFQYRLRFGRSATQGIASLLQNDTRCDCATAIHAIEANAILQVVGPSAFDGRFGADGEDNQDLVIGKGFTAGLQDFVEKVEIGDPDSELQIGDQVYFANHADYMKKHPTGFWQGENALVVGRNDQCELLFSGFGAPGKTASDMKTDFAEAFNEVPSEADRADPSFDPALENAHVASESIPGLGASAVRLDAKAVDRLLEE